MLQDTRVDSFKVTEAWTIARNKAGDELSRYLRHKSPLDLWKRNGGLREAEYQAGITYGRLWREVMRPKSPPHSDPTRIVVDGGSAAPDDRAWLQSRDTGELAEAQRAIGDEETIAALNRLAGMEDWPEGDKRRFKRICRRGLQVLVELWRR